MHSTRTRRRRALAALTTALIMVLAALPAGAAPKDRTPVDLQFLAVSDWHAQLDPLFVFGQGTFGGAAELSAYFQAERAANPNTLTLTAGDAYGASPPLSSFFDEEPAVRSMRMMGFNVDTFGNHNFDRGIAHLQSMIDIAGAPAGVEPGQPFSYVSANLANRDDNLSGVTDFKVFDVGGVKVGVVGITNPEAPTLVFPGSFGTIEVTDPIPAANKAKAAAKKAGAKVIVAIVHMGVEGFDADGNAFGPLIDFANNVGGFDLILGDHTNVEYSGIHNNALVVENRSKGRTYSRSVLTVDPNNGRIISRSNTFVDPVSANVTPDPAIAALLDPLRTELAAILGVVIGESTRVIPRADACGQSAGRICESLVGNVTTDAMRLRYGTDFGLTNAGGLRADLTCPVIDIGGDFCPPNTPPNLQITSGQVLTVLPFGNQVVTLTVNGAELKTMLENGVSQMPAANGRFAQVSGLCFTYDIAAAAGSRVLSAVRQAADGSCTGAAVDLSAASSYTLASNDFLISGGDSYPNFISRAVTRELMDQVVADYVAANTPISPAIQGRVACTSSGATVCPTVVP